ncbi:MAG: peptide/nickel transport system permease protein, partial [Candidatus Azotimanducaceae bacterium]
MEPLTWTGSLSFLNLFFALAVGIFAIMVVVQIFTSIFATAQTEHIHSDGTIATSAGIGGLVNFALKVTFMAVLALVAIYLLAGILMGTNAGIFGGMAQQL